MNDVLKELSVEIDVLNPKTSSKELLVQRRIPDEYFNSIREIVIELEGVVSGQDFYWFRTEMTSPGYMIQNGRGGYSLINNKIPGENFILEYKGRQIANLTQRRTALGYEYVPMISMGLLDLLRRNGININKLLESLS